MFKEHHIPGLEQLASADLVIFFPRLLTLPMSERELIVKYIDSGKSIISIRTGNHGFHAPLPYKINGKKARVFTPPWAARTISSPPACAA